MMPTPSTYLKPEVKIEPLVHRWTAWPHLIAPATHALNLAQRYLPKLRSFAASPAVHLAALKDPAMIGGPFVALGEADVPAVQRLIDDIAARCAGPLAFARALRELDERVQAGARGGGLDALYAGLPAALRGKLELVYDLNHHARIKVIEELLYGSEIDPAAGHAICLHTTPDDQRPFFMSAPMLDAPDRVILPVRFDDPGIDALSAMRTHPAALHDLPLPVDPAAAARLFTEQPPVRRSPDYDGDGVRVRYFGHACVLLQTAQTSVLLDPVTAWQRNDGHANLTFADLPDHIDYVVITHSHQDHFVPEMLIQLRHKVGTIIVPGNDRGNLADPSMKLILQRLGYDRIVVVQPFETVALPDGEILSLPFLGEHAGLDIASKQCVAVTLRGRSFAFLVDSDGIDPSIYRSVRDRAGRPVAAFIGMECRGAPLSWLYGPLLSRPPTKRDDESRRLSGADSARAWGLIQELGAARAFVYAMGQEPWLGGLMGLAYEPDSIQLVESDKFVARCHKADLPAERLMGCREMVF
jgi:L-ascorbate metabolism protein UlaG (beta-lactamase superfamily)